MIMECCKKIPDTVFPVCGMNRFHRHLYLLLFIKGLDGTYGPMPFCPSKNILISPYLFRERFVI